MNTSSKAASGISMRSVIGVDISQHAITMVQLSGRSLNQIQLEKYVVTKLSKNIVTDNKIQDYDQLVAQLQHTYAQLHSSSKNLVAALPLSLVTVETATFNPKETDLDLEDFAEFEISQIAPISEMNYDYQAVDVSKGQQLLLAAAKKDDIEPRIDLFETAGLPLSVMDVDLFAQSNAFSFWINQHAPELMNEKVAIIGIHATHMYALITQNGQILYKQETSVSNEQLNQLIQRTYQISEDKADQMMGAGEKPAAYQTQVADRFNIQVAQEIQRVLQFYYTTQSNEQFSDVKRILLTGKASQQSGLPEAIFAQTNTATECIHPVLYATTGNKIDSSQLQIDAPSLTVAFGLALRGL